MISVVVPVYNAESYLADCVRSVLDQTNRDLELILVNDGSRDGSLRLCRELAATDERIVVIDQPNAGVSAARNTGLARATGEFVVFVDSDDMIEPTMLEDQYAAATGSGADIVISGFRTVGKQLQNDTEVLAAHSGEIEKRELLSLLVSMEQRRIRENMVRCLFRRSLLSENGICFRRGMKIAEDYLFFLQAIKAAGRIFILPKDYYIYRVNDASATAKYIDCLTADMVTLDEWVREEICGEDPQLLMGYHQRRALTYLRTVQNMCLPRSPFSTGAAIKQAKAVRREGSYSLSLRSAYRRRKRFSRQDRLSITMLRWHMDCLYVLLYKIYKKKRG